MCVLVLEASTSSAKAMLYDAEHGVLRVESEPYDDEIFEDAGKRWGIGKTAAKEIYYSEMAHLKANHRPTYDGIMSSRRTSKIPAGSKRDRR